MHEPTQRSEHSVFLYENDAELFEAVRTFVADGGPDAVAIAVVTPEHWHLLDGHVGDVELVDAAMLLGRFNDDGVLDEAAFDAHVGQLVREAGADGRPVRVFGEMVALLWDEGLVAQAVELESFWNTLAETVPFDLLCAYPSALVLDHDDPSMVNDVCGLHRSVCVSEPGSNLAVRAFVPAPRSIGEVRRYVERESGAIDPQRLDKLLLIVSELATNAVQHAQTPFVVGVDASHDAVCVTVRDRVKSQIAPAEVPVDSESGRGLVLVDALADVWGVRATPHGKVVWAEVS